MAMTFFINDQRVCVPQELAALRRPLLPILDQLERLQAPSFMRTIASGDVMSLDVLVRRVKDALAF